MPWIYSHCLSRFLPLLVLASVFGCSNNISDPRKATSSETGPIANDRKDTGKKETISITVDGDHVTPEENAALAGAIRQIVSEAIANVLRERTVEMCRKLKISGDTEMALLGALPTIGEVEGGAVSIYLLTPGKPGVEPNTIVLMVDKKPFIRLTRSNAPIERPTAIMTATSVVNGQPSISEWLLSYDEDGQWKKQRAITRTEAIDNK
jgi:hypothetical protein